MERQEAQVQVQLTESELDLIQTALGLLESTLGKEEADELEQVKHLIARLEAAQA